MENKLEGRQIHFPVLNPIEDFEYWNFTIKTQNGEFIKLRFSINDTFTVPVKSGIEFKIINKEGGEIRNSLLASSEKVSFDTEKCNIEIDGNWCVKCKHYYELYVKINGNGAHLKLFPVLPNWTNGKDGLMGKNMIGTRFLGWNLPITHARVEGVIFNNNKEQELIGTGILDHSWGNEYMGKEVNYLYFESCFLNELVWIYYIALLKDGTMGAKLLGIDNNGLIHDYMKDYIQKDMDLKISNNTDQYNIHPNLPQTIILKNHKKNIEFKINIKEQASKEINVNNGINVWKSADFTSEVNLSIKDTNLKKIFKTTSIIEFHSFL